MRIKDSANNFGKTSTSKFATANPFDCFIFYEGYLMPLELKSTKGTSFSIQSENLEKGKDIKYHQIVELAKSNQF
jgi:penicillin-binding protein-related factor A (putative recombinase)